MFAKSRGECGLRKVHNANVNTDRGCYVARELSRESDDSMSSDCIVDCGRHRHRRRMTRAFKDVRGFRAFRLSRPSPPTSAPEQVDDPV